mmetsp:Transcript_72070/g.187937  ORF Transcript_72070/g.187937 Transcript_72070/m.187937 type:complete len:388 (+) Transcript_72070:246-1409(+)
MRGGQWQRARCAIDGAPPHILFRAHGSRAPGGGIDGGAQRDGGGGSQGQGGAAARRRAGLRGDLLDPGAGGRQAGTDRTGGPGASAVANGLCQLAGHLSEPPVHGAGAVHSGDDEARREALPDLHDPSEELRVVEALREGRHGHDLGDGAEAVHRRFAEACEILQGVGHQLQRICDELVEARERLLAHALPDDLAAGALEGGPDAGAVGSGPRELAQIVGRGVLLPHALGPERAPVHVVLQVVPDDVGLLQEQAHGVGQPHVQGLLGGVRAERPDALALRHDRVVLHAPRHEYPREALADQAGDHVAVAVIGGLVDRALAQVRGHVLGHACAHLVGDVPDDFTGTFWERLVYSGHSSEILDERCLVGCPNPVNAAVVIAQALIAECS